MADPFQQQVPFSGNQQQSTSIEITTHAMETLSVSDKKVHLSAEYDQPNTSFEIATQGMEVVVNVIEPFIPLFANVSKIATDLTRIYENAKCNRKICAALVDRVDIVERAVKYLQRHKQKNEKNFSSQPYYDAWVRLCHVLEDIKDFAKNVTQLSGFRKYANANSVREKFDIIVSEFESVCGDLQLTMAIYSDEQREQEYLDIKEDLDMIGKLMDELRGDVNYINDTLSTLSYNVEQLKMQISKSGPTSHVSNPLNEVFKVPSIKYSDLKQPDSGKENRRGENGKIIKKIYCGIEVACKRIPSVVDDDTTEAQKIQTELAILGLLGKCDHIITFYGLSEVEKESVMVFAWATYGSLKYFYEKFTIDWHLKLKITRDIFNGLFFIHSNNILHHDVRCENILITENKIAKISNFEMSRSVQGESAPIRNLSDYIRWMSPEKMKGKRYTYYSEMFSFGMLLWELCHEKIPYETMSVPDIQNHVKNKGREIINLTDNQIHKELTKIIRQAWQDDPDERPSYVEVHTKLKDLHENYTTNDISPKVLSKRMSDSVSYFDLNCEDLKIPNSCGKKVELYVLKPFEDGLKYHKERKYKEAWECFDGHANLGYNLAKYWKG
ncbi:15041_t:CDS:2, partial [Acaulospora morrowiae]